MLKFFLRKKWTRGSIAILLSLLVLPVLSLSTLVIELERYQSAKELLREANDISTASVLANYNTTLQSRFGLYAFDEDTETLDKFMQYLQYNSNDSNDTDETIKGFSKLYNVDDGSVSYETMYNLANYYILRRQILEKEKYSAPIEFLESQLNIEDMLKELRKKFGGELLEKFDKFVEHINKLVSGVTDLSSLELSIAQLDMTVKGEKNNSVGEQLRALLTGKKEIEEYDPTYNKAYKNLINAIKKKINFLKSNGGVPSDPGKEPEKEGDEPKKKIPYTQSEINDLNNKKTQLNVLKEFLEEAKNCFTIGGFKEENINTEISITCKVYLKNLGVISSTNKTITWRECFEDNMLKDVYKALTGNNYEKIINKNSYNNIFQNVKTQYNEVATKIDSGKKDNPNYETEYAEWKNKKKIHDQWVHDKEIWDSYQEIQKLLNSKLSEYKKMAGIAAKNLASFLNAISKVSSSLNPAIESLDELINGEIEGAKSSFNIFSNQLQAYISGKTKEGIDKLEAMANCKFDIDSITQNSKTDEYFQKIIVNDYYLSYAEVTNYLIVLNNVQLLEKTTQLGKLLGNIKDLANLFSVLPRTYDKQCTVELNDVTYNILPSVTGNGESQKSFSDDAILVENIIQDADNLIGSAYGFDSSLIFPEGRTNEAELTLNIENTITKTVNSLCALCISMEKVTTAFSTEGLFGIIVLITEISDIIENGKSIISNINYLMSNFKTTISVIINEIGYNILLNQYAIDTFPNRVSDISGRKGLTKSYTVSTVQHKTFSQAQVEYILSGTRNEINNQTSVFWKIFILRLIVNIVTLLTNEESLAILEACNIFSLIVFPVWAYCETNLDMNYMLLNKSYKVFLLKKAPFLSVENLIGCLKNIGVTIESASYTYVYMSETSIIEKEDGITITNIEAKGSSFEVTGVVNTEKASKETKNKTLSQVIMNMISPGQGSFEMSYEDYLWLFLFFTGNKTKVMRMADLIQMEMRYTQAYDKGTSPTFLMEKANTYVRSSVSAKYCSVLPVISLGRDAFRAFKVSDVTYAGY